VFSQHDQLIIKNIVIYCQIQDFESTHYLPSVLFTEDNFTNDGFTAHKQGNQTCLSPRFLVLSGGSRSRSTQNAGWAAHMTASISLMAKYKQTCRDCQDERKHSARKSSHRSRMKLPASLTGSIPPQVRNGGLDQLLENQPGHNQEQPVKGGRQDLLADQEMNQDQRDKR